MDTYIASNSLGTKLNRNLSVFVQNSSRIPDIFPTWKMVCFLNYQQISALCRRRKGYIYPNKSNNNNGLNIYKDDAVKTVVWFQGGAEILHDKHLGADVLSDMDGDVHPLLADMAGGEIPCATHAG